MNIFIRTDGSNQIGTGHVMRCLVLASELCNVNVNVNVSFICRSLTGNLVDYIEDNGFKVYKLPDPWHKNKKDKDCSHLEWLRQNWTTDAKQTMEVLTKEPKVDWLILDHYSFDQNWESAVQTCVDKLMVIDDLANRLHDCHLLLDQNLYRNRRGRYGHKISDSVITLLGPKYLLLRSEFKNKELNRKRTGSVERILVSFGGADPTNETLKVLRAINQINRTEISIDVVLGHSSQHYQMVRDYCQTMKQVTLHFQIDYIAKLMSKADLAIGAGGSTTWERCYLCLPTITIETADNQSEILTYLDELGAIRHLGVNQMVSEEKIVDTLNNIISCPIVIQKMSENCKIIMKEYEHYSVVNQLMKGV
ncbi:UDP-2,4-diacetamido-2,4,6-trideoxy-beta-L-altropyranose hydrolase [Aquibacillus koreensis]|uniref:UDP-2,4-diacetamido-2,4, 6-trideoxy-beta-L-altropyranose hydrolase n=1 Tax=Aquibacillus koreensis TaxID=279446 RepID=A0A9X4AKE6_9BACI|nr:UDP-2,4-diacetamido-2,4,6-trideoxy-beta-L-altropyranose hydrolase [Aquibacillus koreensis]MCT2536289.1 UDP-2,4-diacetamido-2,4,6-trideoxy-beta-L-altropyranose hydrolase [Aquibacillus koreensis]MDC3421360.1 UDP-2,4-diacetamido-2,4,6-trideoxy-beta-L-altropyranose hydrolase [Aquibacillus koreensis]